MDGIITVLTVLLFIIPVIAKAIEKVLIQAGKQGAAGKVRGFREKLEGEVDKGQEPSDRRILDEPFPTVVHAPETPEKDVPSAAAQASEAAFPVSSVPEDLLDDGYRSIKDIIAQRTGKSVPGPAGHEPERKSRLEIDPRKLILYSEIMKTKF